MRLKFNKKKKTHTTHKHVEHDNEDRIYEENVIHDHQDKDGKIIFLHKNITPTWLISELNRRFGCNKNRESKCGGLPA